MQRSIVNCNTVQYSNTMNTQQQQYAHQQSTKKVLLALVTTTLLALSSTCSGSVVLVEAFRPIHANANANGQNRYAKTKSSSTSSSKLFYLVFGGDQESADSGKVVEIENDNYHGYAVADHENEKSFWLQTLQNLDASSSSSYGLDSYSLWARIACAFAPPPHDHLHPNMVREAVLVRVGDTDLDIAVAVPAAPGGFTSDQHLVQILITVEFPDAFAYDKNDLSAVIQQVRLLERNANDRLLHEEVNTEIFESFNDPNYYHQHQHQQQQQHQ